MSRTQIVRPADHINSPKCSASQALNNAILYNTLQGAKRHALCEVTWARLAMLAAAALLSLLLSACDALPGSCGATGYDVNRYFTDPAMLAVAKEIDCGRVPSDALLEPVKPRINDEVNENMTLLWWAYLAKDAASFEALLKAGADATIPLKREKNQLTPIRTIVLDSDNNPAYLKMLEAYLKQGGDPNFIRHESLPPANVDSLLEMTGVHGSADAARLLLKYGADPNRREEETSLHPLESAKQHFKVFKLIYEAGGDWERAWRNDRINDEDNIPFAYSFICGYVYDRSSDEERHSYFQVLQFLYERGHEMPPMCLERINKLGQHCLKTGYPAASYFDDPAMLAVAEEINCGRAPSEQLIAAIKTDINSETASHMTLLRWAYLARNPAAFDALLAAGADATTTFNNDNDKQIMSPILEVLVNSNRHPANLKMLEAYLKRGGNPDFAATDTMLAADRRVNEAATPMEPKIRRPTMLSLAARKNLPEAVRLLLKYGADPNARSATDPLRPLEKSVWHFEIFKMIYDAGGDWGLLIAEQQQEKKDKIPYSYRELCGPYSDTERMMNPDAFINVIRFLIEKGYQLPQMCLDHLIEENVDEE